VNHSNTFVEIYKSTLEFLGKVFVPVVVLIFIFQYREQLSETISKTFEGRRVSAVETLFGSLAFEDISEELATADPGSEQEGRALRKIETGEELVKFESR